LGKSGSFVRTASSVSSTPVAWNGSLPVVSAYRQTPAPHVSTPRASYLRCGVCQVPACDFNYVCLRACCAFTAGIDRANHTAKTSVGTGKTKRTMFSFFYPKKKNIYTFISEVVRVCVSCYEHRSCTPTNRWVATSV